MHISTRQVASKKVRGDNVDFSTIKIISKKVRENNVDFSTSEITSKKRYVETTWIFRLSELHQKSTWKWRENSWKFGLRRIDVISTLNRCGFDVVFPLGTNTNLFKDFSANAFKLNISMIPYNSHKNKPIWNHIHLLKASLENSSFSPSVSLFSV